MRGMVVLLLGGLVGVIYFTPGVRAGCGYGYSYPTYYPSYSYPSYSYSYHCAGCWRGNYYPAGWYAWVNGAWYHRELGYNCYDSRGCRDYVEPVFLRYAAVLPLVDLPTYSAQYSQGGLTTTRVTYQTQQTQAVQAQQVQQVQGQVAGQVQAVQQAPVPSPGVQAQQGDLAELKTMIRQVLDGQGSCAVRMDKLEKRVELLEGNRVGRGDDPQPPPLPPVVTKDAPTAADLQLVIGRCAQCHQEGAKGLTEKTPVLLTAQGQAVALDDSDAKGLERVLQGETVMPPKKSGLPSLTAEEKKAIRRLYGL